jgi:hypothetical protein
LLQSLRVRGANGTAIARYESVYRDLLVPGAVMTQDNCRLAIEFAYLLTAVAAALSSLRADTAHFNGNGWFGSLAVLSDSTSSMAAFGCIPDVRFQ